MKTIQKMSSEIVSILPEVIDGSLDRRLFVSDDRIRFSIHHFEKTLKNSSQRILSFCINKADAKAEGFVMIILS
jgi:hypothetical protein